VALDISTSSVFEPETIYDPPIEEFVTNDEVLIDGVQYLTIQFENQVGWGAILHRKIQIDTIPPKPFTIDVRAGNSPTAFPLLTFEAVDEISGIERYEMTIADGEPIVITPDEAKLGYLINELEDGTYTVRVTAFDFAGNETTASVPILITAGWLPPLVVEDQTSFLDLFKGKNLAIIILLLIIIAQIVSFFLYKKRIEEREQKLRKETREIQDQMETRFTIRSTRSRNASGFPNEKKRSSKNLIRHSRFPRRLSKRR
jgi:hypothetical protein